MPQEIPGYYYDVEKNRYFPIKGPNILGTSHPPYSSTAAAQQPPSISIQASNSCGTRARASYKLLHNRELNGNNLSLAKGRRNFEVEFQKRPVSQPVGMFGTLYMTVLHNEEGVASSFSTKKVEDPPKQIAGGVLDEGHRFLFNERGPSSSLEQSHWAFLREAAASFVRGGDRSLTSMMRTSTSLVHERRAAAP
ncbi:hypothetical protein Dsin_013335 [Dipteronia sinensis]|uniref:Uncharacterized protein n=1 Tax=Dipteronia sinensis TaxID=43782 RepID=A0AAE0AKJ8_9ROSI|nr:hypothetical protein Dsin_013335 [Dipteronia sinensis]